MFVPALHCIGHDGPHNLHLLDRLGATGTTLADVLNIAINHAFVGDDSAEAEAALTTANAILDATANGEPALTDEQTAALLAATASARDYMRCNHYADNMEYPEDAMAAQVLDQALHVDICWEGR